MPNAYTFPVVYTNMLDAIFKKVSVTNAMLAADGSYKFSETDAKTVYLQELTMQALGDYTRDTGYDSGTITVDYQAYAMGQDRSKKFILDVLDAKEAYMTILKVAAEFTRTKVIPEIDAYRISKICSTCGTDTTATLTDDTVMNAIRVAKKTLDDAEVPSENRVIYVSSETMSNMEQSGEFFKVLNVDGSSSSINTAITSVFGMQVIEVPLARFYSTYTFATSGAGGFATNGSSKEINFIVAYAPALVGVVKHVAPKIIVPELNQGADGWIYAYRIYHELFVPVNKLPSVYIHTKA
jgi:hypothetical protein